MKISNIKDWCKEKIGWRDKRSYALDDLDLRLEPFLDFEGGVFVEAGANDGVKQSNTLYFERYKGWTGLLIEPTPRLAEQCRENRPNCNVEHAALVAADYPDNTVELRYCDLMSVVKGGLESEDQEVKHIEEGSRFLDKGEEVKEVSAPAKTLSSILDQYGVEQVDLLSLDVEGYEAQALRGIDFQRHRPRYILIEVRDESEIESVIGRHYCHVASLAVHDHRKDMLFEARS
jgi:FkbM family methyltransferase